MKIKAEGKRQPVKIPSQNLALQLSPLQVGLLYDEAQQLNTSSEKKKHEDAWDCVLKSGKKRSHVACNTGNPLCPENLP